MSARYRPAAATSSPSWTIDADVQPNSMTPSYPAASSTRKSAAIKSWLAHAHGEADINAVGSRAAVCTQDCRPVLLSYDN